MKHIDTIVLVKDIARTKAFYTEVMQLEVLHDWSSMVIFTNRLAFHQIDQLQPQDLMGPLLGTSTMGPGSFIIYIAANSVETEWARLEGLGVEMVHGIVELPWQKIFRMRDDNGYLVEIGEEKDC